MDSSEQARTQQLAREVEAANARARAPRLSDIDRARLARAEQAETGPPPRSIGPLQAIFGEGALPPRDDLLAVYGHGEQTQLGVLEQVAGVIDNAIATNEADAIERAAVETTRVGPQASEVIDPRGLAGETG